MEFKKFTAGEHAYGLDENPGSGSFYDPKVTEHLSSSSPDREALIRVLLLLSSCHTVIINPTTGTYNASSPDELALVNGAKQQGFEFIKKDEEDNVHIRDHVNN